MGAHRDPAQSRRCSKKKIKCGAEPTGTGAGGELHGVTT